MDTLHWTTQIQKHSTGQSEHCGQEETPEHIISMWTQMIDDTGIRKIYL